MPKKIKPNSVLLNIAIERFYKVNPEIILQDYTELLKRINEILLASELPQEELAAILSMSRSTLRKRLINPNIWELDEIKKVLKVLSHFK